MAGFEPALSLSTSKLSQTLKGGDEPITSSAMSSRFHHIPICAVSSKTQSASTLPDRCGFGYSHIRFSGLTWGDTTAFFRQDLNLRPILPRNALTRLSYGRTLQTIANLPSAMVPLLISPLEWLYEILWGLHKNTMPVFLLISSHLPAGNLSPAVEI